MPNFLPANLRALAKRPAFTLAAISVVALGVALATTAASIVDALVFRPIPVDRVDQLHRVQSGVYRGIASAPAARDVFERADAPAFSYTHRFSVEFAHQRRSGMIVTCELQGDAFGTLGWGAAEGRLLQPSDYLEGSEPAAVLSHAFWQTELAGQPGIVGETLFLNGKPFRIVGILPLERSRVSRTIRPQVWMPLIHTFEDWAYENRNSHSQTIIARLDPSRSLTGYQTQLDHVEQYLKTKYTAESGNLDLQAVPEVHAARADSAESAKQSYVIIGLVAALLLTACFNVGNMLLANAYRREREFAIRRSVGASPLQIARQLLGESAAIALAGGLLGVALANLLVSVSDQLPFTQGVDVRLDGQALLAAAGAILLTALISGLAPAWHLTRGKTAEAIKRGAKGSNVSLVTKALVVAQLAICGTLLSATLHYTLHMNESLAFDPGYDVERLASFNVSLQSIPSERREGAAQDLRDRVAALPGVEAASFSTHRPLNRYGWSHLKTDRFDPAQENDKCFAGFIFASRGFLDTLGVPIIQGRDTQDDEAVWPFKVALVNEAFQERFFPDSGALGQEFWPWGGTGEDRVRIVGVFKDFSDEPWADAKPLFVMPQAQSRAIMHVRASGSPDAIRSSLESVTRDPSNEFVAEEVLFFSDAQKRAFRNERSTLLVLACLALSALLLSSTGIWYTTRQFIRQSRKELSIRLAIGATPPTLLRLSLRRSFTLIGTGLAFAAVLSYVVAIWLQSLLKDGAMPSLLPSAAMIVILLAIALAASYLPARAALNVAPKEALNEV